MTVPDVADVTAATLDELARTATRSLFFTGKGGVGKTTVSGALALRLADGGRRTLLVSTDPASNLDDVFGMQIGAQPTAVPGAPRLWVMNLDPVAEAATYRESMIAPYRGTLPPAALRNLEEQLSGACTVEIAAFNAFTGLLTDEAFATFDHVVFDTAPTGHTLRLLSLPSAWTGFIETNTSGVSCLGPLAGLEKQQEQYRSAVGALTDAGQTTIYLVARPEVSALREAARASAELAALGVKAQRLVVNGRLGSPGEDQVASAMDERQAAAMNELPVALANFPRLVLPLVGGSLLGLDALRDVGRRRRQSVTAPAQSRRIDSAALDGFGSLQDLVGEIAASGHGVVMTMGKGGVGKTSIAAALARALASAGQPVHLSTTDPAAHVDGAVGLDRPDTLTVSRIDPEVEIARYTSEVLSAAELAAGGLEPEERALLEEDLRSPCTEEIAVFRAFARTVDEASDRIVVLDTAPTGHTLLLLDAAESYHREVARTTGSHIPESVRALLPRLRDPQYTRMVLVTLAESTPVLEAERLQADLRRAGIEPFGWVVNASLAASHTNHPLLAARAALEVPHLRRVQDSLTSRAWLLPWQAAD
jgi:arsenite-transporting ATPase